MQVFVDAGPLGSVHTFSKEEFQRGIVLTLADSIVLLLHPLELVDNQVNSLGFVGHSACIHRLRSAILNVADLDVPVLLKGESGVGKELVASAIHRFSKRSHKPYICINMSAVPKTLAVSELFGHAKGTFTGAEQNHLGYSGNAEGGTLFLDEIGETSLEVQPILLRAIENKKLQPLGGKIRDIDIRLIAATDYDLEQAIEKGLFRRPLFERLSGYQIKVPPLRERRDDIGRLFISFLRQELEAIGQLERLKEQPPAKSWIPARLVAEFARYRWPGNVRQLQNVTRQLVISNRDSQKLNVDPVLEELFRSEDALQQVQVGVTQPPSKKHGVDGLTEQEVIAVLRRHQFNLNASAEALGISRNFLNQFIEKSSSLRQAKDLSATEIKKCAFECDNDIDQMAARLEVSSRGLKLQMKRLGL